VTERRGRDWARIIIDGIAKSGGTWEIEELADALNGAKGNRRTIGHGCIGRLVGELPEGTVVKGTVRKDGRNSTLYTFRRA
jgi:hypothetical protein